MSYARFDSGSDIYLDGNPGDTWTCYMCKLAPKDESGFENDARLKSLQEVWDHLREHKEAGHLVHESCEIRVKREMGAQTPLQSFTEKVAKIPRPKKGSKRVSLKRRK